MTRIKQQPPPPSASSAVAVLFRCDGAPDLGLGHVVRCLALAVELRERHGFNARFLVRRGPVAVQMVETADFPVERPANGSEPDQEWISRVLQEQKAGALIMDFRAGLSPDAVRQWRRQGVLTVTLDDPEDKRVASDLVFSPPVPQVRRANWTGFTGTLHAGWEWVLLRHQFAHVPPARKGPPPLVLVAMGGSDPAGLTLKAVRALDALEEDFRTIIVVGGAFCHDEALAQALASARRQFEVRRNVSNMAALMVEADLAVASFCVTAYELSAVGVPAIFLCLTEDHAEAASLFVENGMGINLGVHTTVTEEVLAASARRLLRDSAARHDMSRACRRVGCGRGAANIAAEIARRLEAAHAGN